MKKSKKKKAKSKLKKKQKKSDAILSDTMEVENDPSPICKRDIIDNVTDIEAHFCLDDENFLERALTQWQFGDWKSLVEIDRDTIKNHPYRAKLALLAAAGHLQINNPNAARQFVQLAKEWGCERELISRILIAGVHNSLARAAAMAGNKGNALDHFEKSIFISSPGSDLKLNTWARATSQLDQIELVAKDDAIPLARDLISERDPLAITQVNGQGKFLKAATSSANSSTNYISSPYRFKVMAGNQTLAQIYLQHRGKVSDKWTSYLVEYERILSEYQEKKINVLEVGVQNGGSLEIWSQYFPKAKKIVGCDVNSECAKLNFEDSRVVIVIGDANSDGVEKIILKHAAKFEVVIDDGSHRSSDIIRTFARYFRWVQNGGVYIVEDLHCSYWQKWEGGLFAPYSSLSFFKSLADIVNHEHWGTKKNREDILEGFFYAYDCFIPEEILQCIHSIQFFNSLCVVRKEEAALNSLGKRTISGSDAFVNPDLLRLDGSTISKIDESDNLWTDMKQSVDANLTILKRELAEHKEWIVRLKKISFELKKKIADS